MGDEQRGEGPMRRPCASEWLFGIATSAAVSIVVLIVVAIFT
jgi:hypothetical protein